MRIDGILLAGGAGRRFGGPKAIARLAGETLVERGVAVLAARCANVVVVSRPGVPLPALPVPVVHDRPGPDAPLVAVATGLAAVSGDTVMLLGCDLPLAGPLLDRMRAAAEELDEPVALVGVEGSRPQPLCGLYPREATLRAAERLLAADALPVRGLLDAVGALGVPAEGDELLNVNTPADLERARRLLEG